jgi:hypothetical protein
MDYWVYENWTVKKAKIHRSDCSHCNEGPGTHPGSNDRNEQWHGPFSTVAAATQAAARRATDTLTEYMELLMANDEIPCTVAIAAEDSARSPQLQATDFVIGSIYAAYAHGDWRYLNALRSRGIVVELRTLKKKTPAP